MLQQQGHSGRIYSILRSGSLAIVRGMNGPATKCYLTEHNMAKLAAANGGMLSIETGAHLIKQELLATKESTNTNLQQVFSDPNPLNWFNQEIYLSHNKIRPWQKALHTAR